MSTALTHARWRRIEELFESAIERDTASRAAFLAEHCSDDVGMRAELESLISAHERSGTFLETPVFEAGAQESRPKEQQLARNVGPYRILRVLGRGGMGVVYEAVQDSPRREVALKVVRGGGFADPQRIKLFQREADSLARLEHPSIATIHDAGRTDEGDHYFAMELVRGVPLGEYVRTRRPGQSERLALFLELCAAVEYAHQRGVIHRDLKPSNVLVTEAPSTRAPQSEARATPAIKVIDFGLARLQFDAPLESTLTEPGRILGTLPYMSPEQARGRRGDVGARSDVYALGVILYELLTGRLPLDVSAVLMPEAVRLICEATPERPSSVDRALRGDLETILLKVLEKEPARRYASAGALAQDVERYLAGRPILARAPSASYQLMKLVARHKLLFALAAASFVLLAAATAVSGTLYARARSAERQTRVEAQNSKRIAAFLQEMLASADPTRTGQRETSVREVLDRASERLASQLAGMPEVEASVRVTIASAYSSLGLHDRAEPHLRAALELRRVGLGDRDPSVADVLDGLGVVAFERGDYAGAERTWREALDILRAAEPSAQLVQTLVHAAGAARKLGDGVDAFARAEALFTEALEVQAALSVDSLSLRADILNEYSSLLVARGDCARSEEFAREALAIHRACSGERDLRVAQDQNDLAVLLASCGKANEAEELYRSALTTYRDLLGPEHPSAVAVLANLGNQLSRAGPSAEAEAMLREALELRRKLLGADHPDVAWSLNHLGLLLKEKRDFDGARAAFDEALEQNREHYGEWHLQVGNGESNVGVLILERRGDAREAEEHLRKSLAIYERVLPEGHFYVAYAKSLLGCSLIPQRRFEEAERLLRSGVEALSAVRGPDSKQATEAREWLSQLYRAWGKPETARSGSSEGSQD